MAYQYSIGQILGKSSVVVLRLKCRCLPRSPHCMGPRGISVQLVVDLYRGDRFVAATNHTVKMCIYLSIDFALDFNLSISVST